MDNKIDKFNKLLESKRDKYPNITNIWKNYINQKHELFDKTLDNGIRLFTDIERRQETDLNYETILSIYLLLITQTN